MKIGLSVLIEIIRGGWITARHFLVNMFFHTIRLIGFKGRRKGAVTIQYPDETKPLGSRHRSLHRIVRNEDGKPRCVACMLCVTVCPSECIFVEAGEEEDPEVQKSPAKFVIDLNRCCFCGFCIEACPVDAIRMDTKEIRTAASSRGDLEHGLDKL